MTPREHLKRTGELIQRAEDGLKWPHGDYDEITALAALATAHAAAAQAGIALPAVTP